MNKLIFSCLIISIGCSNRSNKKMLGAISSFYKKNQTLKNKNTKKEPLLNSNNSLHGINLTPSINEKRNKEKNQKRLIHYIIYDIYSNDISKLKSTYNINYPSFIKQNQKPFYIKKNKSYTYISNEDLVPKVTINLINLYLGSLSNISDEVGFNFLDFIKDDLTYTKFEKINYNHSYKFLESENIENDQYKYINYYISHDTFLGVIV